MCAEDEKSFIGQVVLCSNGAAFSDDSGTVIAESFAWANVCFCCVHCNTSERLGLRCALLKIMLYKNRIIIVGISHIYMLMYMCLFVRLLLLGR